MNNELASWVNGIASHTKPEKVHFCDGSPAEARALEIQMVSDRTLVPLNEEAFPRCFLHRSQPNDVARTEKLTFICTDDAEDAGPTNNWMAPTNAESDVWPLFAGSMRGRTMYVVPYLMGPSGSQYVRAGVQVTDSPYVAASL